jgi:hypothetical protein
MGETGSERTSGDVAADAEQKRTAKPDEVIELDWSSGSAPAEPTEKSARKVEDTRAYLAFTLVGLLGGSILCLLALLFAGKVPAESFAEVAGIVISPLVGLVGAVTGYYYGKADNW